MSPATDGSMCHLSAGRRPPGGGPAGPNTAEGDHAMKTATKTKAAKKTTTTTKTKVEGKPKRQPKPNPKAEATPKKASCLDAAAQVLKDAGEPMQVRAMVTAMKAKGLWSSDAATPWATLYSAILREIANKKGDSRFKKTDRGHFALNA